MNRSLISLAAVILSVSLANATSDDSRNCKIVEREGPPPGSDHLSTSVTAGNGRVSTETTGANGITVHSGNGSVSSSSSATTGNGQTQTVTTNSDGTCTIYRYKDK